MRLNHAGEELLGIRREELIGKSDYDLFEPVEADFFVQKDREVLESGSLLDIPEETIQTKGKGSRVLHTRKIGIPGEDGKPRYLLGISEDITDQHEDQKAAEAARAEAERANRAKSEFLSRMSHELRTPLNAVIGSRGSCSSWTSSTPASARARSRSSRPGATCSASSTRCWTSRGSSSGTMSISLEPVHLGSVLAEALSLIRPLADDAQVYVRADPASLGELHVHADQQRLTQVLINLLSNAVKYNRQGGSVSVDCAVRDEDRVEIAVADTGRGLGPGQLERLFVPFDRMGAESGDVEGTGLGLSLSIGLMRAMGGTIVAESEPDVGTTMRAELERARSPPWRSRRRTAARPNRPARRPKGAPWSTWRTTCPT